MITSLIILIIFTLFGFFLGIFFGDVLLSRFEGFQSRYEKPYLKLCPCCRKDIPVISKSLYSTGEDFFSLRCSCGCCLGDFRSIPYAFACWNHAVEAGCLDSESPVEVKDHSNED
jgi:hypothetical protein